MYSRPLLLYSRDTFPRSTTNARSFANRRFPTTPPARQRAASPSRADSTADRSTRAWVTWPQLPDSTETACVVSRATHLQIEAPDLQLLVRIRRPLDIPLHAVGFDRLDHGNPGQILEHDLGHFPVRSTTNVIVDAEVRRRPQFVETRMPPVRLQSTRAQKAPHHAVRVPQRGRRVAPSHPLEALLTDLLHHDGELDDLQLHVRTDVVPH